MNNTSALRKKLFSYSALASAFIAIPRIADAQIMYTDILPDDTLQGSPENFALDLNNDGNVDFYLRNGDWGTHNSILIRNYEEVITRSVLGTLYQSGFGYAYPFVKNAGDFICSISPWAMVSYYHDGVILHYYSDTNQQGNWQEGIIDGYMGLRFRTPDWDTLYAWLRVDVATDGSLMIVKDYACNLTPDGCINAGEGSPNAVAEPDKDAFQLSPNPAHEKIFISGLNEEFFSTTLLVFDLEGKQLLSKEVSEPVTQLDISSFPAGTYFLQVRNSRKSFVKKFEVH